MQAKVRAGCAGLDQHQSGFGMSIPQQPPDHYHVVFRPTSYHVDEARYDGELRRGAWRWSARGRLNRSSCCVIHRHSLIVVDQSTYFRPAQPPHMTMEHVEMPNLPSSAHPPAHSAAPLAYYSARNGTAIELEFRTVLGQGILQSAAHMGRAPRR